MLLTCDRFQTDIHKIREVAHLITCTPHDILMALFVSTALDANHFLKLCGAARVARGLVVISVKLPHL